MTESKEKAKPSSLRLLVLSPSTSSGKNNQGIEAASTDASNARFTAFLSSLTGTVPSNDLTTFAGYTSHPPLTIRTKYYAADVSLWCDELPSLLSTSGEPTDPGLSEWSSQMLSAEAEEVREVIGGIIVLSAFNATDMKQNADIGNLLKHVIAVNELRESIEDGSGRDVPTILSVQDITPTAAAERHPSQDRNNKITAFVQKLEDACLEEHGIFGWDIVAWEPGKSSSISENLLQATTTAGDNILKKSEAQSPASRNEFGEKLGIARVLEVLEQVNWSASDLNREIDENSYDLLSMDDFLDSDTESQTPSFKPKISAHMQSQKDPITEQSDEFQQEIMVLHFALEEQKTQRVSTDTEIGDDIQVEQLSSLMEKVVAIKEAGSEMSKSDREKFARREVARIMREMNLKD